MTRETYRKMTGYFLQDEKKVRRIILANRLLTGIVFVSYPLYLISLLLKRDTLLAAGSACSCSFICGRDIVPQ